MKIIRNLSQINIPCNTAVAIGKFDGVHVGHKALISKITEQKKNGLSSVLFTFSPSPAEFFGFSDNKVLTTDIEKELILSELGVDYLIEYPFNKENAGVSAHDFIMNVLVDCLHVSYIAAGEDLSFGFEGKGNMDMIMEYSSRCGFVAEKIEKVKIDGELVSSTIIRNAVFDSQMVKAERYIGCPYFVSGRIEHGAGLGHTIGFPTINIIPDERKILPKPGVYYSRTAIDGKTYNSITNVGVKPTVTDAGVMLTETYIYDFNQDVYGHDARVYLLGFEREEMQFSGISELKNALLNDIAEGKVFFHM